MISLRSGETKDDYWTFTTTDLKYIPLLTHRELTSEIHPLKRFNCKRCGATNQIEVCEYCGSAFEEEVMRE